MHLSEESRFKWLMGTVREPSPALLERFVNVDGCGSMAFVAVAGPVEAETIIGVARYACSPGSSAGEFAIAVADEWQSRGVGTALLQVLFEYARLQGLHCLWGRVLAGNERMLELARKQFMGLRRDPSDATLIEVSKNL